MSESIPAIGIDLGTTNSCVGVYRNGRVEIIANDRGSRLTPSVVAFTEYEMLIGDAAKLQRSFNPSNTVYEVKRLIGRKYYDDSVQRSIKHWPFVVTNNNGNPNIKVKYRLSDRTFTPEQISAMILGKMKEIADTYLDCKVRKAVITVPAYFTDSQRQATIDAGTIAGLEVLKIINEPTAAAIAYGERVQVANSKNILIFDFGGGTFDVSILNMKKGQYEVKAIQGNSHLGGSDLDNRLCEHLTAEFRAATGIDVSQNSKALSKMRTAAEQTKIHLSSQLRDSVQVESVHQGQDFKVTMSRVKFEHLCDDLFQKTMKCVDDALTDAGLTADSIDVVVLVGGSAWIPKIEKMVKNKFVTGKVTRNINPSEAVAYGAAVQAAMLNDGQRVEDIKLSDVTPLSLGASMIGDRLDTIIKRNSPIPAKFSSTHTTVADYQKSVLFRIYEGENPTASKNNYLGEFTVENIELAPTGVPKFDVTFALDSNGILNATAVDRKTGSRGNVTVSVNKGRLVKEDIESMVTEMGDLKAHEDERRALIDASASLEETIAKKRSLLERKKTLKKISQGDYERMLRECEEAESWLEDHEDATKREFNEKEREFNQSFTALFFELQI